MKKLLILLLLLIILLLRENPAKTEQSTELQNVWDMRCDLRAVFPDGENGINQMQGWTLTQWASEFGWKEYKQLKWYGQTEKDYIYEKYLPLEKALRKVSSNQYTEDYHCSHFSDDLRAELKDVGISSLKVNGKTPDCGQYTHWWVAVQFEPITGGFITEDYEVRRVDGTKRFLDLTN